MIPPLRTRPSWLPLRLIVGGGVAACALLSWQGASFEEWPRLLAGLTVVSADGTTLAAAMARRAAPTVLITCAALLIALTAGLGVAFVALRLGTVGAMLVRIFGRLLAALPVAAMAWLAVGWTIGIHGWPVESLLPHHPVPGRDTWELALGRRLWWWLVPCWVLAAPLAGEVIARTLELFVAAKQEKLMAGLRARGLKRAAIHYHHSLPALWPDLLDLVQALGLLAFGYVIFVEEALGIPGWGAFFAASLKTGNVPAIAGCAYFACWLAAGWSLLIGLIRHLSARSERVALTRGRMESIGATAARANVFQLMLAASLLFVGCGFGEWQALAGTLGLMGAFVPALMHDLRTVCAALAPALLVAIALGGLAFVLNRKITRLPGLGLLQTVAWSPLLVWALAIAALVKESGLAWLVPGVAISFAGALQMRNHLAELQSGGAIEAARVLGASELGVWRRHIVPGLLHLLLSWLLQAAAVLLVWTVLSDSLQTPAPDAPPASLGLAIAAAKDNVLADLPPLLAPAAWAAICALCFSQLSRIVRPVPPAS